MIKKLLIALFALLIVGGAAGWVFRKDIILFAVTSVGKNNAIAETRPVPWMTGPTAANAPLETRPPNIVFIIADDMGINDISTFGGGVAGGRVPTPNIDRLAAQGAVFTQAYAGTATCAPSRAMMMTGRYPTRTGFEFTPTPDGMGRILKLFSDDMDNGLPPLEYDAAVDEANPTYNQQGLPGSEVTVAEMLKTVGYHTVHIGKWHLGLGPEYGPNAQGFDESLLMASALHLPANDPNVVNARLPFDPIDIFLWARLQFAAAYNEGEWFKPGGYLADYWTDEAIKVIRENRNRPFFLNVAHWGVHTPLQATKEDFEAVGPMEPRRLQVYAAMVRSIDRSVGRIMEALEAEGLAENTIIVFTSDNGGAGYIGLPEVNKPYRGWKMTLFEGGIKVPLFISWPGRIQPGSTIPAPVGHIDITPTLAAAAGASLPQGVAIDGVDLLPHAMGAPVTAPPHEALFWQSGDYKAVRQGDWKLQVSDMPAKTWLYDLASDPTEKTNLSASRPDKVAELTEVLRRHHEDAVPSLYKATVKGAIAVDKTAADEVGPEDEMVYWPN
jgi:uncharacterized sulfatase